MTGIGFFSPPHYALGRTITFEQPEHTAWTITTKRSQQNSQLEEFDVEPGLPSWAFATFLVRSPATGQEAYMRVYQQVPHLGPEFFPLDERAKQAAPCYHREVQAIKAFHEQKSTITPALLAIKEDVQDSQGFVPGGYIIHIVFQRVVHGVRLVDDRILPGWRDSPHTFFAKSSELEREQN